MASIVYETSRRQVFGQVRTANSQQSLRHQQHTLKPQQKKPRNWKTF
jgi:hypothetical protein